MVWLSMADVANAHIDVIAVVMFAPNVYVLDCRVDGFVIVIGFG